jgi:predicted metal-dependent hydrolase
MPQPALPFDADHDHLRLKTDVPSDCAVSSGASDLLSAIQADTAPVTLRSALAASPVFVRHPRARRYVVRVKMDGTVRVTIPRWGTRREAAAFADAQRPWIEKQLRRVAQEQATPHVPMPIEQQQELRKRAVRELPPRLLALAEPLGLTVTRISIRNQRSRWGSCSRQGHICLNWRLVAMPDWVRDYVLFHELMHLKRMDHSPAFWTLVANVYPGFKDARDWLRAHQDLLAG